MHRKMQKGHWMKIEILVTTMFAQDFSKVEEMNLYNVDVLLANQTDECGCWEKDFPERGVHARMVCTNTRGAGLNRNVALSYATGDIIVFADDDMRFSDDFAQLVQQEFAAHPEADGIKFSCRSTNPRRFLADKTNSAFCRARVWNLLSGGIPALALRREKFCKKDLFFPTSIGPGCKYSNGEDSIFLKTLLDSKLKIYISPILAAYIRQENSCWFHGYTEDYFITAGYVYARLYGRKAHIAALRRAWKMRGNEEVPYRFSEVLTLLRRGIREYEK